MAEELTGHTQFMMMVVLEERNMRMYRLLILTYWYLKQMLTKYYDIIIII